MLFTILLFLTLNFVRRALAADNSSAAATFVFTPSASKHTFVFALNAEETTGDLYFHLEAPAGQAWAAVGMGSEMEDALMFAAYASKNGTGVTVSPRIATGHSEPSYTEDVNVDLLRPSGLNASNTIYDGKMRVDAVCRNCTSWLSGRGQLDLTSTAAPFIFAVGPGKEFRSSSLTASMRRHDFYGHFTMNMKEATSSSNESGAAVPAPNGRNGTYENSGASEIRDKDVIADNSTAPAAHALIMIAAFVFLFPLGSLLLRVMHKALWHGAVQVVALLMIMTGFGLGIYLSTQYNKSKNFASAHQLIGILIIIALLFQFGLGLLHHRMWKHTQSPTKFSTVHKYLGPAIFLLGLINGGLGFNFADNSVHNSRYVVVILTVAVLYCGVRWVAHWWDKRKEKRKEHKWVADGNQQSQFGPQVPYGPAVPLRDLPSRA